MADIRPRGIPCRRYKNSKSAIFRPSPFQDVTDGAEEYFVVSSSVFNSRSSVSCFAFFRIVTDIEKKVHKVSFVLDDSFVLDFLFRVSI